MTPKKQAKRSLFTANRPNVDPEGPRLARMCEAKCDWSCFCSAILTKNHQTSTRFAPKCSKMPDICLFLPIFSCFSSILGLNRPKMLYFPSKFMIFQ